MLETCPAALCVAGAGGDGIGEKGEGWEVGGGVKALELELDPATGRVAICAWCGPAARAIRELLGISQVEVACRGRISEKTVRRFENHEGIHPDDVQARIAFALGLQWSELIYFAERLRWHSEDRGVAQRADGSAQEP